MSSEANIITLILCGGIGSRLWPLSRPELPKQFASILPGKTLFERTVERNRPVTSQIMIAANRHQASMAFAQMEGLGIHEHFGLIEPVGRNTAPAMALSAMLVNPDDIIVAVSSDHIINKTDAYHQAILKAVDIAREGRIVTLGIRPEYPETGYGYIETAVPGKSDADPYRVESFREKPDAQTAAHYLKAGNYYWNSGMFCFRAEIFLEELKTHADDVYQACLRAFNETGGAEAREKQLPWAPDLRLMESIPAISVDYAVMERSTNVAVLPCDIGWSDLGSLDALYDYYRRSAETTRHPVDHNISVAGKDPVYIDAQRNMVISGQRQVALIDVDDLIVVETPDALLVTRRGSGQKVKQVIE